jgi:hypothetical protein
MSICDAITDESKTLPFSKTAAAVSSQEDSIAKILTGRKFFFIAFISFS